MGLIGRKAPSWGGQAALNGEKVKVSSDDLKGKWYVLFFYPLDFTFVCPTEIVAFDDALEQFTAAGATVIGCSVDSVHTHLAYTRTSRDDAGVGNLKFPLLADLGKTVMNAWDVSDASGEKALRATFVVDPDGVVQAASINNLSIGRSVDEILRLLQAAQFTREHGGEVCPANWHAGDKGMKESLAGVKSHIGHH